MSKNNFWQKLKNGAIIAHRGYRAIRAENTLSAFEIAKNRCDLVELDVGFSKDGVALVIHDKTLTRTTNVKDISLFKAPYRVLDYTYDEISKLDASSWFLKEDPFGTIKNSIVQKSELQTLPIQKIPTLKDALLLLKKLRLPVNIEIKDFTNTKFDKEAPIKVLYEVEELNMQNSVIISSFNHNYLKKVKELNPQIEIAILQDKKHLKNIVSYLKKLDTNNYNISLELCNRQVIKELKEEGINISVFTVNSKKVQKELFNLGVKAVFSDFL